MTKVTRVTKIVKKTNSKSNFTGYNRVDKTGNRYGRLLVKEACGINHLGKTLWLCVCDCGNEKVVVSGELNNSPGKERVCSCGCLAKEILSKRVKTHGMSKHKLYTVWNDMKQRCYDKNVEQYKYYGGRGITVCEEWLDSSTFFLWALKTYSPGLVLDRIDNDKGYSPDNCRFTTVVVNNCNRGVHKRNTTGYSGVSFNKQSNKFISNVSKKLLGSFSTVREAVEARNKYIIDNSLPYKIQEFI